MDVRSQHPGRKVGRKDRMNERMKEGRIDEGRMDGWNGRSHYDGWKVEEQIE